MSIYAWIFQVQPFLESCFTCWALGSTTPKAGLTMKGPVSSLTPARVCVAGPEEVPAAVAISPLKVDLDRDDLFPDRAVALVASRDLPAAALLESLKKLFQFITVLKDRKLNGRNTRVRLYTMMNKNT